MHDDHDATSPDEPSQAPNAPDQAPDVPGQAPRTPDQEPDAPGRALLGIGALSRASGLSVSALRFYDREGVLVPADVDGTTGYRRYHPEQVRPARLLAGMRRIQIPVSEMVAVLESLGDDEAVGELLDLHLSRLEQGLADARREVARLRNLAQGSDGVPRTLRVDGAALHTALGAVRYAAGDDPQFPVLSAVLLDRADDGVRAMATDRFRLAVALVEGAAGGDPTRILLPLPLVDRLLADEPADTTLEVTIRSGAVAITACSGSQDGLRYAGTEPEGDYPDVRRVLENEVPHSVEVPVEELRAAVREGAGPQPDRVRVSPRGTVEGPDSLLVDRGFLWDALERVRDGHVVLPLGGLIAPLLVRSTDASRLGLVMPVREES